MRWWRRLRVQLRRWWRGRWRRAEERRALRRISAPAVAQRLADGPPAERDALSSALLRLREAVAKEGVADLTLAWYAVDEAKAAAVRYSLAVPAAHPAVLDEELALAQRLWRKETESEPDLATLLAAAPTTLPQVRYRLLVALLPSALAAGGDLARTALEAAYEHLRAGTGVPSPYGRLLLAEAVCRAGRDAEELARQRERFRQVTTDQRAEDGSLLAFVAGGEFDLPQPVSLSLLLDLPGLPTRTQGLKRDAPREIAQLFLGLTPRSREQFMRAFRRREDAYRSGRPWTRPPHLPSEGTVFLCSRVTVASFFIDREPITVGQYARFVDSHELWRPSRASRWAVDRDTYLHGWRDDAPPPGTEQLPVTNISYQAARAYLAAAGRRLPSEAQWLLALVGPDLPETRQMPPGSRPSFDPAERAVYAARAGERGLGLHLPERLDDYDGCCASLPYDPDHVVHEPRGPDRGTAHIWRTPTARGPVPDRAGDANLTFRGVLSAASVWTERAS